ncbi:arginine deiminase [Thermoanaerobacter indiensis]|uniref:arginine deiminase n=1 Tax=Thermoanaerobacter indiensis TaxID=1125974 RepID=UPI0003678A01|nr:arginine deiminase [Thermoanaerobacter indiensis]
MEKNTNCLRVYSEIGKLKSVLLHRPGKELERLTPEFLSELLFDDIPWLKRIQEEHDKFAQALKENGVTVYYLEDLLEEVLQDTGIKEFFIYDLVSYMNTSLEVKKTITNFLKERTPKEIVDYAIAGLLKKEVHEVEPQSLVDYVYKDSPFFINPLPNCYFMRDPAAVIGNGVMISSMKTTARKREAMLLKYVFKHSKTLKVQENLLWYDYHSEYSIEGGDVLVLSKKVIAIGISERTSPQAIEEISLTLLERGEELQEIIALEIPKKRTFMHLDTVFTMVDVDKFLIYPGIKEKLKVYRITRGEKGTIRVKVEEDFTKVLETSLGLDKVNLIESGGGDEITGAREQWNDSTNTLAIAPGVVMAYNRNEITNTTLVNHGIKVIEIEGSELVRGRGGPRCMSMPLKREDI